MSSLTVQKACTWSGIVGVSLFFMAFILASFLPPPSPSLTRDEVAEMYRQHSVGITLGMLLMMVSGMFICPLVGVISAQLKRIPGISSALVYGQICAGSVGVVFFIVPAVMFIIAAYRPERPAELTYLMNDACWIMAVLPFPPAFMQNFIIGVAILSDRSAEPIFPRWVGYVNFWVISGFLPTALLPFFRQGVFAWNGLFVFWLAAVAFGSWFIAMTLGLLKAINGEGLTHQTARPSDSMLIRGGR